MSSAIETLGMSLPYSSSTPALNPLKLQECRCLVCLRTAILTGCVRLAGEAVLEMMEKDLKPRDIMTRAAFDNAITMVMALGGSTNAVLHLIAIAQ